MNQQMKKKRLLVAGIILIIVLLSIGILAFYRQRKNGAGTAVSEKEEAYPSLSASDQETADLYAQLYETTAEEVARLQVRTGDWEQTGKELEKEFFTIPENVKYQMSREGYSLEDLEEAEKLSVRTGRKAMELIQAKGKAAENKSWADVVEDDVILSAEEQLGLTKKQVKMLKKRSLKKQDRLEAAILILNGSYTFDEVIQELDGGKKVEELKKSDKK